MGLSDGEVSSVLGHVRGCFALMAKATGDKEEQHDDRDDDEDGGKEDAEEAEDEKLALAIDGFHAQATSFATEASSPSSAAAAAAAAGGGGGASLPLSPEARAAWLWFLAFWRHSRQLREEQRTVAAAMAEVQAVAEETARAVRATVSGWVVVDSKLGATLQPVVGCVCVMLVVHDGSSPCC